MAEKILVELKKSDGAGEIVPYIEQVAKPGPRLSSLFIILLLALWYIWDGDGIT